MNKGIIFNEEKILYFANSESSFHIQPNEPKHSDANIIVSNLVGMGCLVLKSSGDGGRFYEITDKGRVKLLKLQIAWRKKAGKSVERQEKELRKITDM